MNKLLLSIIITAVVVGSGAFYGGMKYGQSQIPQRGFQQFGVNRMGNGIINRQEGGFISGEIITKDSQSLTTKQQDGSSKIVFFTENTPILKNATGTVQDLIVGGQISINGTANSDGSISAQSIQIRPTQNPR